MDPVTTSIKLGEELKKIFHTGNEKHLEKICEILNDPKLAIFNSNVWAMKSVVSMKNIDKKVEKTIEKRIKERDGNEAFKKSRDIIYLIHEEMNKTLESDVYNVNTADFLKEGMTFTICTFKNRRGLYCVKHIDKYRVRYEGFEVNGVWEFPACMIGIEIIPTKIGDKSYSYTYSAAPVVIYPKNYLHPFVSQYEGNENQICSGTFGKSKTVKKINELPFIESLYAYMIQIEQILRSGYEENVSPANGHLSDIMFNPFKIFDSVRDEERAIFKEWKEKRIRELNAARTYSAKKRRRF
jgi:hypothetical protein